MNSTGDIITGADLEAHNQEVWKNIEEFEKTMVLAKPSDVGKYNLRSGLASIAMLVEDFRALGGNEAQFAKSISRWTNKVRIDGSSPRLDMTKAVLRTPVQDLWFECRGEVWTARELWEYCQKLHR